MSDFMCAGTILQQTGWNRPYPQMICQEQDVLLKVYEHDFDLKDEKFREYVANRGIMSFKYVTEQGTLDRYFDILMVWDEAQVLEYYHGEKALVTCWKLTKAKIQDCWELYKENEVF